MNKNKKIDEFLSYIFIRTCTVVAHHYRKIYEKLQMKVEYAGQQTKYQATNTFSKYHFGLANFFFNTTDLSPTKDLFIEFEKNQRTAFLINWLVIARPLNFIQKKKINFNCLTITNQGTKHIDV